MKPYTLSVCIITFNEAQNIRRCLESVKWADEIVVVDSHSTDETVEICSEYTEMVFVHKWEGHVKQKNIAVDQARGEWILCIDADESLSPELSREIKNLLAMESIPADGYRFLRRTYYLDRWIRYGDWNPDYNLRLFKKEKGRWEGTDPHDHLRIDGTISTLESCLEHYNYQNISHQVRTMEAYSNISVKEMIKQGRKFSLFGLLFRPFWRFIRGYFIKMGFLDGLPGLVIAMSTSYYVFLKYSKLWEATRLQLASKNELKNEDDLIDN